MREYKGRNLNFSHDPKLPCILVPASAEDSPLIKDLKRGQKPYFYSIMRVYKSKASREMLHRRYVINLQHQHMLGLITEQQAVYYASYLRNSEHYQGTRLGTAPPWKADCRKAQLGLIN
ncbi:hypothetical protein JRQ81_017557 [Phrynocephalus forsythii]|uniref:Uncharacterized protein n=1 Tax=Phrynocephalus forsythii TaxID=171643 RepID=A0A9Q1B0F7_9SAUR|nr:hypothetical protein JRQ81_017557 [Phrynocephalus forsythii]